MIILDPIDESAPFASLKSQSSLSSQHATCSSESVVTTSQEPSTMDFPPPYSSSRETESHNTSNYDAIESQISSSEALSKAHQRRRKRFKRIFRVSLLLTVFVWLIVTTMSRTIWSFFGFRLSDRHDSVIPIFRPRPDKEPHSIHDSAFYKDSTSDSNGATHSPSENLQSFCLTNASWSDTVRYSTEQLPFFSADASFQLPISAQLLSIISRGPLSVGRIQVIDSALHDDVARVHVTMRYTNISMRDRATVCLMVRSPGNPGVGIFTSVQVADGPNENRLDFDVTVMIPPTLSNRKYNLEIDLPMFVHGGAAVPPQFKDRLRLGSKDDYAPQPNDHTNESTGRRSRRRRGGRGEFRGKNGDRE